jgi:P pilus assembly chaperone PapD
MTTKTLTVGTLALTGILLSSALEAMGATDTAFEFVNDGSTAVAIENGSASPITVTIDAQSIDGLTITDPSVTIAAGATRIIKALDPKYFNNSSGKVTLSVSAAATTVKAYAFRVK